MREKESNPEEERFNSVIDKIGELVKNSSFKMDSIHSKAVLKYVLELKPEAGKSLQIAALAHDIDRAIEEEAIKREDFEDYDEYKRIHALKSAEIISEILKKAGYQDDFIENVRVLVEQHEVGGEGDAEILKEADSLAFFQYNLPYYLETHSLEQTKDKIRFMYGRLGEEIRKKVKEIEYPNEIQDVVFEAISPG